MWFKPGEFELVREKNLQLYEPENLSETATSVQTYKNNTNTIYYALIQEETQYNKKSTTKT